VQGLRRRRQPAPSGVKKLVNAVNAATARKAVPNSKKGRAGGLALVAAALGMAIKNRDRLPGRRGKDARTPGVTNSSTPSTPHGV
jgi:hypothetical protein